MEDKLSKLTFSGKLIIINKLLVNIILKLNLHFMKTLFYRPILVETS